MITIYLITNTVNGKQYCGQSIDFNRRMRDHKRMKCNDLPKLYNAIAKYGWDKFKVEILELHYNEEEANTDNLSQKQLASKYKVSSNNISLIINNITWKIENI